ncbi:hypothetical protein G7Y89_g5768 [Cudoniella acicularis]|uniref:AA9 family lytic polysaccharide monooxygenase n=1 Tax=Cudoniella acicularis TaxID=354080 RepID=A0A8H4RNH1_9HELO|nr:hypothetical protein G7Y89_g5768 [Cudoniella acicularis]
MTCFQVNVSGSGTASPEGVSFPGAYKASDPGILVNIYNTITSYTIPGLQFIPDMGIWRSFPLLKLLRLEAGGRRRHNPSIVRMASHHNHKSRLSAEVPSKGPQWMIRGGASDHCDGDALGSNSAPQRLMADFVQALLGAGGPRWPLLDWVRRMPLPITRAGVVRRDFPRLRMPSNACTAPECSTRDPADGIRVRASCRLLQALAGYLAVFCNGPWSTVVAGAGLRRSEKGR